MAIHLQWSETRCVHETFPHVRQAKCSASVRKYNDATTQNQVFSDSSEICFCSTMNAILISMQCFQLLSLMQTQGSC